MKETNLPSALVKTICALHLSALVAKDSPSQKALIQETKTFRPGFWLIERSSIMERRKEFGCFSSIVRLICFYQICPGAEVEYCAEISNGEFIKWSNCEFISLIPHDYQILPDENGSQINQARIEANLSWAKEAASRHKLAESLEDEERIFFDVQEAS